VAGRSGGWGGRSPVATNCFGLTLSAQPQRVRPMSAFIQVISRVLQSEERNSFNSWPVQPIVAERIARKYWPHRD
jgi:hypothetical protein